MILKLKYLLLLFAATCSAQQQNVSPNAQPRVAPALQECYRRRELFERDNRLPMTPNMLIELIRRVEDSNGFTLNLQQFTTSLLHRFKQDGIVPASVGVNTNQDDILQFSTAGFNFARHRLLLTRLIPGNAQLFPDGVLSIEEHCALHFMLSSSIEFQVRGDEGQRCNQLAQYRAPRIPRDTEDVELMKTPEMSSARKRLRQKFGKLQNEEEQQVEEHTEDQVEDEPEQEQQTGEEGELEIGEQNTGLVDVASNAVSQCPVENGVMFTSWGSVAAGTVIAGIAAGLERQWVTVQALISDHQMGQYKMARQTAGARVDNHFAATLSGDIAETVLRQVPNQMQVGAAGGWNNTAIPRWYFLSQRERLEMTDAEIRGGIDGLVLGTNIVEWRNRFSNLRLSQVLDMYYSQRGMFGLISEETALRSCNRRNLFPSVAPMATLREQSFAFTSVLDGEMINQITLTPNSTSRYSNEASEALHNYITGTMSEIACTVTATTPNDATIWRAASDLYIFIDSSWTFRDIQSAIGHLLNSLDVGRFGTTYTLLSANTGNIIVNTTSRLSDLYTLWNQTVHDSHPPGLDLPNILRQMRNQSDQLMLWERNEVITAGRSLIALIVANTASVNDGHTETALQQLQQLREIAPDLRFLYWAGGITNRFDRFVREPSRDIYPLRIDLQGIGGDSIQTVAFQVIHRIQQEPRRIINHRCGPEWQQEGTINNVVTVQYVEPRGIVFYRLHPNYFFHGHGDRRLRVRGSGYSSITVCHSRSVERPRANVTNNEQQQDQIECRSVNSDTIEINLSNSCDGNGVIHQCQPLFISVEGTQVHDGLNLRCSDRACRFPDDARFEIHVDHLGCFSSARNVLASALLLLASILVALMF